MFKNFFGRRRDSEQGRGRQPGGSGLGLGGECVCPKCGAKTSHQRGVPCYEQFCPKCSSPMARS